MRGIEPPLDVLLKIRKLSPNYRALFIVGKSDKEGYDYETTAMSDGLPPPYYKDPACGSANKMIPLLIKTTKLFHDRFKTDTPEKFRMFYPYNYSKTGIMGGIQDVEYDHKNGKTFVVSGVTFGKNVIIRIKENKINFDDDF
ncbi:hypothetical protein FACS189465_2300 [Clostridia bacterium]|nr:hypothetical protein FACS189465_2300 [Clostridia bacterium]